MTNAEKYLKDGVDLEEFSKSIMTWYFGNYAKANDFARIKNWAEHKIETLTEDERVILKFIENFDYIGRDKKGLYYELQDENIKEKTAVIYNLTTNLFQFIKERRKIRNSRIIERRTEMTEIDKLCDEIVKDIDEKCFEFLNKNGYKIEKPYTREKALAIFEQLKQDGKKLTHECVVDKIVFDEENNRYQVINKILFKLEEVSDENN